VKHWTMAAALAVSLAAAAGCGGGGGGGSGTGTLELLVTDDPFAHGLVAEARVTVSEVRLRGPSGWIDLLDGPPVELDVVHLRNGATALLTQAEIPAGSYDQLRLVVDEGYLKLIDDDEFSTALGNLHPTSTSTSGLKLDIDPPLGVVDGVARSLLLDLDLTKTFKAVPGEDPLSAAFYQLHPVIHVANLSTTGEVRGFVREDTGTDGQNGLADATIYLLLPGETDTQNAVQTTATEPDGAYALIGVEPGTYDVLAELGPRQARSDGHEVLAGSVTEVDFLLP
jgi:hypothetical protein